MADSPPDLLSPFAGRGSTDEFVGDLDLDNSITFPDLDVINKAFSFYSGIAGEH